MEQFCVGVRQSAIHFNIAGWRWSIIIKRFIKYSKILIFYLKTYIYIQFIGSLDILIVTLKYIIKFNFVFLNLMYKYFSLSLCLFWNQKSKTKYYWRQILALMQVYSATHFLLLLIFKYAKQYIKAINFVKNL